MFRFLKGLPLTFYSIPFYRDLIRKGKGIGLSFLFAVLFLNLCAIVVPLANRFHAFFDDKKEIFSALPELTVQDGQISMNAPSPKEISFTDGTKGPTFRILFDMQADSTQSEAIFKRMAKDQIIFFATKDALFFYNPAVSFSDRMEAATIPNGKITHEDWVLFGKTLGVLFLPLMTVSLGFSLLSWHLLSAFAGAVLLLVIAPLFKLNPPFAAAMRVAAAAKVPVAVCFLLLPPNPSGQLLIWFGFAAFGLLSSRNNPLKAPRQP